MKAKLLRCIIALQLATFVVLAPFVDAQKAHAFAPAAAGAAAGAAALAAELGITTEGLMTGLAVATAAGTGVWLLNSSDYSESAVALDDKKWGNLWNGHDVTQGTEYNWNNDYQKYKFGNGKSWDELTDSEKANWDTPAEYVQSQWLGYLLGTGLIQEVSGGGGFEPTPNPDYGTDPDGFNKWQKARNLLTILGVSGAAVGLGSVADFLADMVEGGIYDLIHDDEDGLAIPVLINVLVDGHPIIMASLQGYSFPNNTYNYTKWSHSNNAIDYIYFPNYGSPESISWTWTDDENSPYGGYWQTGNRYYVFGEIHGNSVGLAGGGRFNATANIFNMHYPANLNFNGKATLNNGNMTGTFDQDQGYEGTMNETPIGLPTSTVNNNTYKNFIQNYGSTAPSGKDMAVTVPSDLNNPDWTDVVKPVDEGNVTEVPDDDAINRDDIIAPGSSSPDQPTDYPQDFTDTAQRLLSTPFDQLFPFCLIADMRDLTLVLLGGQQETSRLHVGTLTTQSDTPTDELNGIHNLHLDFSEAMEDFVIDIPLDPVHELLGYGRFTFTCLLIMGVVIESMEFFLKRGA